MTKEITKAFILQQIQDKFKLRELEPEVFRFSEEVVPVYDIGQHLKIWESYREVVSITGSGAVDILTVPATERWLLRAYTVVFVSGAYTIAGVYILRNTKRDENDFSYLDLTAGQSSSYLRTLPVPVVLEPGDELKFNIDGYTSSGSVVFHYDFMKEEIR